MKFLHLAFASLLGVVIAHAAPNLNASPTVQVPLIPSLPCTTQPPTSNKTADWSNDTYIQDNMIISKNSTAIFWMGHVPNSPQSVVVYAEDCASRINGVTIGMVMCQNNFTGPSRTPDNRTAADIWNHKVSKRYAEKTSGVAFTVAGNFTSTSDYLADEFPALIQNTNVTAVFGINPQTCKPSCYWYCQNNAACKGFQFCYFEGPWPYYSKSG